MTFFDLGRFLGDRQRAGVPIVPLAREVPDVAFAAADLNGVVGNLDGAFAGEQLRCDRQPRRPSRTPSRVPSG
jgi:hypothetical protein